MEILHNRTTTRGLERMAASDFTSVTEICKTHGKYRAIILNGHSSPCPECMSSRLLGERQEQSQKLSEEHNQLIAAGLLKRAAIPPRFADRTLDSFVVSNDGQERALGAARAYVESFTKSAGQSLILCGGVGAGKTHIAIGIAHELIRRQCVCVFTSVIGAIRSVKETYNRNSDITEREAIANLIRPDLLILDEVGVQFGSDAEKLILFEIINGRYENRKSTIVISNLAMAALSEYLGERVVDRLREDGGRLVVFDWPSFRKGAA